MSLCCRVLQVSRSGYHAWRVRMVSPRQRWREALAVQIRAVHADSRRRYGSPRVHEALAVQGERVCENPLCQNK